MTQADMLSINTVAARLGLSVHQLRRWELMFGLEIKRGRGQQRQYRSEDLSVLERIKELVEQGWPTSQIRPQLEAEGLITPKLIGVPQQPGNPEMLMEAIIGLRSFSERRFIEISKQIDELRQLMISITLRNELRNEIASPWQPVEEEFAPPPVERPAEEFNIGPAVNVQMPMTADMLPQHQPAAPVRKPAPVFEAIPEDEDFDEEDLAEGEFDAEVPALAAALPTPPSSSPLPSDDPLPLAAATAIPVVTPVVVPPTPPVQAAPPVQPAAAPAASETAKRSVAHGLGEVNDQNYLTVLGKALDMIGWSDEQADQYSQASFGVSHWDELGRSQAEKLIMHLVDQLNAV
jgi:DNA-binding transcriptional MerR regulator